MRFAKMPDEPAEAPALPAPAAPVVSKGAESSRSSQESSSESGSSDSEEERATRLAELQEQVSLARGPAPCTQARRAGAQAAVGSEGPGATPRSRSPTAPWVPPLPQKGLGGRQSQKPRAVVPAACCRLPRERGGLALACDRPPTPATLSSFVKWD